MVTVKGFQRVDQLISSIQKHLTPDLLKSEYREHNKTNRMFGHSYVATETLYHLLKQDHVIGSNFPIKQTDKYYPYHAKDENGISHWWLQDELGNKLDVTIDQFLSEGRQPPYDIAMKGYFLIKKPSKRSRELMTRILSDLQ